MRDEDLKISIPCTSADPDSVYFTYDFDGVVIEVKEVFGVVGHVHYLFLPKLQVYMIPNHYDILKKKKKNTEKEISALRNCCVMFCNVH